MALLRLPARFADRAAYRTPLNSRDMIRVAFRAAPPPENGWDAEEFRKRGGELIRSLVWTAKVVQRRAMPTIERAARKVFDKILDEIIRKALARARSIEGTAGAGAAPGLKADISIGAQEDLWAEAIREVVDEHRVDLSVELLPPIQSVMAQGYSKTGALLGIETDGASNIIASRARSVAARITRISDTTRTRFENVIRQSIAEGNSVVETARVLRTQMPEFAERRIRTIARTETMMAWTEGSVASMQSSGAVTHVSVIGCESREEESWAKPSFQQFTYRGEGTCNIQDVPIHDADKLNFHPNHTGAVVPSKFREPDGTDTNLGSGLPVIEDGLGPSERSALSKLGEVQRIFPAPEIPSSAFTLQTDKAGYMRAFGSAKAKKANADRVGAALKRYVAAVEAGEETPGVERVAINKLLTRAETVNAERVQNIIRSGHPTTGKDVMVALKRQGKLYLYTDAEQAAAERLLGQEEVDVLVVNSVPGGTHASAWEAVKPADKLKPTHRAAIRKAAETIDKAGITIPETEFIKVESKERLRNNMGAYFPGQSRIELNIRGPKTSPAAVTLTSTHEMGHWLDNTVLNAKRHLNPRALASKEFERSFQLDKLFKKSKAFERLKRHAGTDRDFLKYAASTEEVWARAFTQWVTETSGDASLIAENLSGLGRGWAWATDDFVEIRKFVEEVLRNGGLIP